MWGLELGKGKGVLVFASRFEMRVTFPDSHKKKKNSSSTSCHDCAIEPGSEIRIFFFASSDESGVRRTRGIRVQRSTSRTAFAVLANFGTLLAARDTSTDQPHPCAAPMRGDLLRDRADSFFLYIQGRTECVFVRSFFLSVYNKKAL